MENEQKLFIFNHRLTNTQVAVFAIAVAEDQTILGSWLDWSHFEIATGLSRNDLGAFVKNADGTIAVSEERRELSLNLEKPYLTGEVFVKHLRNLFNNLTLGQRATLLAPLVTIFSTIEGDTNFTEIEFVEALEIVKSIAEQTAILTNEQILVIYNGLINWSKGYKFSV